jgi:hypothetical protein
MTWSSTPADDLGTFCDALRQAGRFSFAASCTPSAAILEHPALPVLLGAGLA